MIDFTDFSCMFRNPKYPVVIDIDGTLVAAKSSKSLCNRLLQVDIAQGKSYQAFDKTSETWTFIVIDGNAVLSPLSFKRPITKLEIIRWFNNRENKLADEVAYSENPCPLKNGIALLQKLWID